MFGPIINFAVIVQGELRVRWFGMSAFQKKVVNVPFYGKLKLELGVCGSIYPVKVNSRNFPPLPIFGDGVMLLEGL